jgi:hypothetical protein
MSTATLPASSPSPLNRGQTSLRDAGATLILRQTGALLLDAYRELNARRLFWITMLLSGLIVAAFACVGISEKGITVLWWEIKTPVFNSRIVSPATFYKFTFSKLGIDFWLGWLASILALISTASMFPEFVSSGTIDMLLAKPIGRARLFFTKYLTGMLFVLLQVFVFTFASFLVIGFRGNSWEPGLFWAVPLVGIFFSYIYCIGALIGLLTRSTIASLLGALLFWVFLFGLNATDAVFMQLKSSSELRIETFTKQIERMEASTTKILERERARGSSPEESGTAATSPADAPITTADLEKKNIGLVNKRKSLADERLSLERWQYWSRLFFGIKTVLPKTTETTQLIERTLVSAAEIKKIQLGGDDRGENRSWRGQRSNPRGLSRPLDGLGPRHFSRL